MTNPIGIMQGRLSPPAGDQLQSFPWASWADEFGRARECGLDALEWIFEEPWGDNPLATAGGQRAMRAAMAGSGVSIPCACADYFMEHPLVRVEGEALEARIGMLRFVIRQCAALQIPILDIPFVDASAIHDDAEAAQVVSVMREVATDAAEADVRLGLETNLAPRALRQLLDAIAHPAVGVTYDVGNSASLGFNPGEELDSFGPQVINVHVKDRVRGGGTVALGLGDADLPLTLSGLRWCGYTGPLILQVARVGEELAHARQNAALVRRLWNEAPVPA